MNQEQSAPRRSLRVIGVLLVVVALTTLIGFKSSPWFHDQVLESVSRRPAPFTELYFADATKLPKHLSFNPANRFTFVIANHEGRPVVYTATVMLHSAFGDRPLATDIVPVDANRSSQRSAEFIPEQTGITYVVTVRLAGRPEVIRFSSAS